MKTTAYIGKKGAQTLYYAVEVAKYIHLLLNYFLKGCRPDYINIYSRGRKFIYQGIIPGDRRSGTTRNISKVIRQKIDKKLGKNRVLPNKYYFYV